MNQSFARNTIIYGIGDVFTKGLSIVAVVIYARILTPEQFGLWNYVLAIGALLLGLSTLLSFGSDSAYTYAFQNAETDIVKKTITTTALVASTLWSGFIVCVVFIVYPWISPFLFDSSNIEPFLLVFALIAFVSSVNSFGSQILRNHFMIKSYVVWEFVTNLLTILLTLVGMSLHKKPVWGASLGMLAGGLLTLSFKIWNMKIFINRSLSMSTLQVLLRYGFPFIPTYFVGWLFTFSDRFILAQQGLLEELGLFSLATSFVLPIYFVQIALGLAWTPYLISEFKNNPKNIDLMLNQMLLNIIVMGSCLLTGIIIFTPIILSFFFSESFAPVAQLVIPLGLGNVVYMTTLVTSAGITLNGKTFYFPLILTLATSVKIGLSLLFITNYGVIAVAWASLIAFVVLSTVYAIVSLRYQRVTLISTKSGFTIFSICGASFLGILIFSFSYDIFLIKLLFLLLITILSLTIVKNNK